MKDGMDEGMYGGFFDGKDNDPYMDKSQEFERYIAPIMTQLVEACREHHIPTVVMFVYSHQETEDGDGFGMAGGIAGSVNHMPIPMLVASGLMEERVSDLLDEGRRAFVLAASTNSLETMPDDEGQSLWRCATAAQMLEAGAMGKADAQLRKRVKIIMDAFEGMASISPETNLDFDSGIELGRE